MTYFTNEQFTLHAGDARQILPTLPENSIDSIVTDPPYELGFMGKSWDSTGIANDINLWKEVLRVLKPGGYLLSFGGSRTYHRMAVAIEDAGFEIRDQIMWVYGSGFPKSHNISKGIDKAAGAEREVVGSYQGVTKGDGGRYNWHNTDEIGATIVDITAPATPAAKQWGGWGTALKPAHEPIVLARKPFVGTVANNVLTYGVGGLNIDGARVGSEGGTTGSQYIPNNTPIYGKGLGNTGDVVSLNAGRWPANFIHDGSDEVLALFPHLHGSGNKSDIGTGKDKGYEASNFEISYGGRANRDYGSIGGSAARFFYCAKANKRDRNEGLDEFENKVAGGMQGRADGTMGSIVHNQNYHPTVKPTNLMQYLCRLITPPNGTILDPFLGSGSTGKAAIYEGFKFIGIELTEEYLPIAKARIEFALNNLDEKLF